MKVEMNQKMNSEMFEYEKPEMEELTLSDVLLGGSGYDENNEEEDIDDIDGNFWFFSLIANTLCLLTECWDKVT